MSNFLAFMKQLFSILAITLITSCTTTIPLLYSPSNLWRGTGNIIVNDFIYVPAKTGKLKPNLPEEHGMGTIYLDRDIALIFTDAVKKELNLSGYTLNTTHGIIIEGNIDRFLFDWVGFSTQDIEIVATFKIILNNKPIYTRKITSKKEVPKVEGMEIEGMKSVIHDSINIFIEDAKQKQLL